MRLRVVLGLCPMLWFALAAGMGLGCAVAPHPRAVEATQPVAPRAVAPRPVAPRRCILREESSVAALAAVTVDAAARCRPVSRSIERRLRKDVTAAWRREWPKGRLEIATGCDRLADTLATVDVEYSGGHGGSLHLVRFERDAARGDHRLLWIRYNHYSRGPSDGSEGVWRADAMGDLEVLRGRLDAATMTALLDRVRATLHVEITEHEPPRAPGTIHLGGISMSSRDFGVALRLVDDMGHGIERFFAGYESSGEGQAEAVRADLARTIVTDLLYDDAFAATLEAAAPADEDVRALFAQRFAAARARGDDFGKWFIRERFVALTTALGTHREVPVLLEQVMRPGADGSEARTRAQAINAIAALTDVDPRYGADGEARALDVVAAEVLAACRPTTP